MKTREIEEVFEAIQEGTYELTDFKSWLALWSVKVLDMYDESRGSISPHGEDYDNTLSGH